MGVKALARESINERQPINERQSFALTVRFELQAYLPVDAADPDVQRAICETAGAMMQNLTEDQNIPAIHIVLNGQSKTQAILMHLVQKLTGDHWTVTEYFKRVREAR